MDLAPLRAGATALETGLHPELPWKTDPELATSQMVAGLLDLEADFIAALRQKKKPEVSAEARAGRARPRPPGGRGREPAARRERRRRGPSRFPREDARGVRLLVPPAPRAPRARSPGSAAGSPSSCPRRSTTRTSSRPSGPTRPCPRSASGPRPGGGAGEGFTLTDPRMTQREVLGETHYCLLCHEREKDSCSKGFFDAKTSAWQKNPLGISLKGCPLDEKISEMHELRREGDSIGALALVCIDNPMCPGTGHRICNDCMKGCIFQKQEPVNIPQIETGVLTDVLTLPWGVEIYGLLTRWNPLHPRRPHPAPYNGPQGPRRRPRPGRLHAGPLPPERGLRRRGHRRAEDRAACRPTGPAPTAPGSARSATTPSSRGPSTAAPGRLRRRLRVRHHRALGQELPDAHPPDARPPAPLRDPRRRALRRHASRPSRPSTPASTTSRSPPAPGRPTIIPMKNNIIRGVRKASDFLMALQLTGAFKEEALANLQAELPAVVIGGGLTAIDTATELLAYYPIQAEKTLDRYEKLCAEQGRDRRAAPRSTPRSATCSTGCSPTAWPSARSARAPARPARLRTSRASAGSGAASRSPTAASMEEAPAYRLNHEEVIKALEEGISFIESLEPEEAVADEYGKLPAVRFLRGGSGEVVELPARTCSSRPARRRTSPTRRSSRSRSRSTRSGASSPPTAPSPDGRRLEARPGPGRGRGRVLHRLLAAAASSSRSSATTTPPTTATSSRRWPRPRTATPRSPRSSSGPGAARRSPDAEWDAFRARLEDDLTARVVAVNRLTPTIVEVVVRAPAAARNFQPGQFFRLQNLEAPRAAPRRARRC